MKLELLQIGATTGKHSVDRASEAMQMDLLTLRMIELIEAAYDLEKSEEDWLRDFTGAQLAASRAAQSDGSRRRLRRLDAHIESARRLRVALSRCQDRRDASAKAVRCHPGCACDAQGLSELRSALNRLGLRSKAQLAYWLRSFGLPLSEVHFQAEPRGPESPPHH